MCHILKIKNKKFIFTFYRNFLHDSYDIAPRYAIVVKVYRGGEGGTLVLDKGNSVGERI